MRNQPAIVMAALACLPISGSAMAQITMDFTNSSEFGDGRTMALAVADLNGDGHLDVFSANDGGNNIWINDGSGMFIDTNQSFGTGYSQAVALADLDRDGDLDAYVCNHALESDAIFMNDGNGYFTTNGLGGLNRDSVSTDVALGDLDGDGNTDAFITTWPLEKTANMVLLNNWGDGLLFDSGQSVGSIDTKAVGLGDLDDDGDLDVYLVNNSDIPDQVFFNDGAGNFTDSGQALGDSSGQDIELVDIDHDGDLDACIANRWTENQIWLNDGSGMFSESGLNFGPPSSSVSMGDLDGDGDYDACFGSGGYPSTVWANDGTGNFYRVGDLSNTYARCIPLGDINGDGSLDAIQSSRTVGKEEPVPNQVWMNDASSIGAVYNGRLDRWYDRLRDAVGEAEANDTLLVGGNSFNVNGIIDSRDLPLTFHARSAVSIGHDALLLPGNGTTFSDDADEINRPYVLNGRMFAPENGELVFNSLDIGADAQFHQGGCSMILNGPFSNTAGGGYLSGEVFASAASTGELGVNRVAGDTRLFCDYTNAGATIVQEGILYVYGDLEDTGVLSGEVNNGFAGGGLPQPGDGFSIGGRYALGASAGLSMPDPVWRLQVGGDLDIAIDNPARFEMSLATISLNGLANSPGQTLEALAADLGATNAGFDSSNFPIGTLRITSDSDTMLVNNHANSTNDPCEVLYVNRLVIEEGGTLTTGGCRIYTRSAQIEGEVDNPEDIVVISNCPGDIDANGTVDSADLGLLLAAWYSDGTMVEGTDINEDGLVNAADLGLLLSLWGNCP